MVRALSGAEQRSCPAKVGLEASLGTSHKLAVVGRQVRGRAAALTPTLGHRLDPQRTTAQDARHNV